MAPSPAPATPADAVALDAGRAPAPVADAPDDDLRAVAAAGRTFAARLYAQLRARPGNLAVAPVSVSFALGMCAAGARAETLAEVHALLGDTLDPPRVQAALGTLARGYNGLGTPHVVAVSAQRVYASSGTRVRDDYVEATAGVWRSPVAQLDFGGPDGARAQINGWVFSQTRQRVRELVPVGGVRAGVGLVVASAAYFKGRWQSPFRADATRDEGFHVGGGTVALPVATMHQTGRFLYAAREGGRMVRLPYGTDGRFVMDVLLPDDVAGVSALESQWTPESLAAWTGALRLMTVEVSLPRFSVAPAEPFALRAALGEMGVNRVFEPGAADLSGVGTSPPGEPRLFVSELYHAAAIDVVEDGAGAGPPDASAAAQSAPAVAGRAVFRADRPFLFVVRDTRVDAVVVVGRVSDPRGAQG